MDGRCLTSAHFSPQTVQVALVITPVLTFISGQMSSRFWELLCGVDDAFEACGLCKRDTSCWGLACPPPVCSVFFLPLLCSHPTSSRPLLNRHSACCLIPGVMWLPKRGWAQGGQLTLMRGTASSRRERCEPAHLNPAVPICQSCSQ